MNPSLDILKEKLCELESVTNSSEHDVHAALVGLRKTDDGAEPCQEWKYEQMAFAFCENYASNPSGWGTYFGPMMVWRADDGSTSESPSIVLVDKNAIEYWNCRAKETKNPLLRARYSGLVWDLTTRVTGAPPDINSAVDNFEALMQIAERNLHAYSVDIIDKLARALSLALSISKPALVQKAKDGVIGYEATVTEDNKPGLWGVSFDLLVENKKVQLLQVEEDAIIKGLEDRLSRLKDGDPWHCENAAGRLARYYKLKSRPADVQRVIATLGNAFETAASKAEPLVALSWLEHVHQIYTQYGDKSAAERIAKAIRTLGPKVRDSMSPISHKFEIPKEELERYVGQYIQGSLEQAFANIAVRYSEKKGEVHKQVINLAKMAPLSYLCTKQITDSDGRVVATLGSLDQDVDGNIAHQMSQNMSVSGVFLNEVLERVIGHYEVTSEKILAHLYLSPVFSEAQKGFLKPAIEYYLGGQFSPAIHLFVPQIEAAIRNLLELVGGAVLKSARSGGFQLKTLDELLRSKEIETTFGEDTAFYLRVLLTDQRGWNLRNDICHGLSLHEQMNKGVADRLLHALLVLALLRESKGAASQ